MVLCEAKIKLPKRLMVKGEMMAIPRRCEYVYKGTGNRCERLAIKGNPKWYCKYHLKEYKEDEKNEV